jgi:hypothetical protein
MRDLQGNLKVKLAIMGEVDGAHAPSAKRPPQKVSPELLREDPIRIWSDWRWTRFIHRQALAQFRQIGFVPSSDRSSGAKLASFRCVERSGVAIGW